jgi:hypothetical protein
MSGTRRSRTVAPARSPAGERGRSSPAKADVKRTQLARSRSKRGAKTPERTTAANEAVGTTGILFAVEESTAPKRHARPSCTEYDADLLEDAPEHHSYSRALGILTWDIWDHGVRPFEERKRDFLAAFPPYDPTRFQLNGQERLEEKQWKPRDRSRERSRFLAATGKPGSIDEVLARYGLRRRDGVPFTAALPVTRELLQATRERNHALRVLHGSVDVEPADMDAAKVEAIERREKRRAAEQVRQARARLRAELERPSETPDSDS